MFKKLHEKYKGLPLPVKAALWFTICNVILKGISFFTVPLFARILPIDEYGKVSIFASYQQLILIFATWNVALGTYQRGIFKYKNNIKQFTTSSLVFANILTIVVFIFIIVFIKQFTTFTEMSSIAVTTMLFYMFFEPAYQCWLTRKRVEYNYKNIVSLTLLLAIMQIASPLAAILLIRRTANIKYIFTLIPAICIYLIFYLKEFKPKTLIKQSNELRNQLYFIMTFTAPLVLHSLSYLILAQADRVMIGKMLGNAEAGIYSVAYTIANIAVIVQNSINQVVSPWIYNSMEAKNYSGIRKKTLPMILGLSIVYILFILAAPEVIILLFPKSYYAGIWCIPPIAIGVYFMFLYTLFVNIESYLEKTKYIGIVSIICAILNIVLNYFGIHMFGYVACAYTTLICYILFAIGHYYFMGRVMKEKCLNVSVYNGKMIAIIGCLMILLMVGITLLYDFPFIRYGILLIGIVLTIIFRKRIFVFVRQFKGNKVWN